MWPARVADMPFCARCGLNVAEFDTQSALGAGPELAATDAGNASAANAPPEQSSSVDPGPTGGGRSGLLPIVAIAVVVAVALIAVGSFTGWFGGASPRPTGGTIAGAASGAPAAPIVGLTILSPTDGTEVATKDLTVIGTAPPGLTITQDISFGFDQHTTVDGTGHWAIKVGLNPGDNKLSFRIGDDHSTEQTIRVIYTPPNPS